MNSEHREGLISCRPGMMMMNTREPVPLHLAPMEGVSDLAFRLLARECGADLTITEFTSSTALSRGSVRAWSKMASDPREHPFIPQIFGGDQEEMVAATKMLCEQSDAGCIDINFGCPAPKVCRSSAGAAMLADPDRLVALVDACIAVSSVPVSVKLRLGTGMGEHTALEVATRLEDAGVVRLCVHGRTLAQGYRGRADWSSIARIVDAVSIPVIANGDVVDADSTLRCLEVTGAAGVMIGRGAIGNPQIFSSIKQRLGWPVEEPPWIREDGERWRMADELQRSFIMRHWTLRRYVALAEEIGSIPQRALKRHAVSFTKHLPGGSRARGSLQGVNDAHDVARRVSEWLGEQAQAA